MSDEEFYIPALIGFTAAAIGSMFIPFQWWMIPPVWVAMFILMIGENKFDSWMRKRRLTKRDENNG